MPEATNMMRAAVVSDVGALKVQDHPVPQPGPTDVLVKVRAAGVCHTDLHLMGAVPDVPPLPLVLGHEIAGEIAAVGSEVVERSIGERVLVYYYDGCGSCHWCETGEENLCPGPLRKWGFNTDGGYAEYVSVAARCCVELPASVDFETAAVLGCSGTTALHAVRSIAAVREGETALVLGVGGVGLAVVQAARSAGANVVAVGRSESNLRRAEELGAIATVHADSDDLGPVVAEVTHGQGWDAAFDLVGSADTPAMMLESARKGGRLILVGYTGAPAALDVPRIVMNELVVRGAVGATLDDARQVVRLAGAGEMEATVSGKYPLDAAPDVLEQLSKDSYEGRAVLLPNED